VAVPGKAARSMRTALIALVVVVAAAFILFKAYEHDFKMGFIPSGLTVTATIYENEKTWGFGPGGNETGLRVYELSSDSAQLLIAASNALQNDSAIRGLMGRANAPRSDYFEWRRTPVDPMTNTLKWGQEPTRGPEQKTPRLQDYLNVYGFGIPIDAEVERSFDSVIQAPGAFYAYGAGGAVIVVSPETRRVFIAYAG
jgi:hypothetical protein